MNRILGFIFCMYFNHAYPEKSEFVDEGVISTCPRCKCRYYEYLWKLDQHL